MALQRKRFTDFAQAAAVALVLTACGGGSGSLDTEPSSEQIDVRRPQAGLAISNMAPGLTLLAGYPGGPGTLDGTAASARFSGLGTISIDLADNLYVADYQKVSERDMIKLRKISPAGVVTTLSDEVVTEPSFPVPPYSAFGANGTRYVANANSILKVAPDGTTSTLAGVFHSPGFIDGNGTDARLTGMGQIVIDHGGNLYAINTKWTCPNSRPYGCINEGGAIRKITPTGVVTTLAGFIGEGGAAYIDGPGNVARFSNPNGLAIDPAGNLYVGDSGSIRRIAPSGEVTTVVAAVPAPSSSFGDRIRALAVGNDNQLFLLASQKLYQVSPTGVVALLADFANVDIGLGRPITDDGLNGVVIDRAGNLFIASFHGAVYKYTSGGTLSIFAGMPKQAGSVDGKGPLALFQGIKSISRDRDGNLYLVEDWPTVIRKITPDATVTTLGSASGPRFVDETGAEATLDRPRAIAVAPDGNAYVGEYTRIRKLTKTGVLTTFAGNDSFGDSDGVGVNASFSSIRSMIADSVGNLYIAEAHSVRKVTPTGVVTTLAGSSTGGSADGKGKAAYFRFPSGIALDNAGNLYISDTDNATIRKLSPDGVVTTVAGSSTERGFVDGIGSAARFNSPKEMAADEAGNVYVIDTGTVRKVTPGGVVTTIAGNSQLIGTRLGELPGNFARLSGIAYLGANVFVVTDGTSVLRLAVP